MCLRAPSKDKFKRFDSVARYKATSCGDDDDGDKDDNNNNDNAGNGAIACNWILCWQFESHKTHPMEKEADDHSNVGCPSQSPLLSSGGKGCKSGGLWPGE